MSSSFAIGFLRVGWIDVVDVLLVTVLFYQLYKLLTGSVALKIFLGLMSLYLTYLVVKAAGMELLTSILGQFMSVGVIASVVLFQQEIRRFLLNIGKATALERVRMFSWRRETGGQRMSITPFVEAAKSLSGKNTGALIAFTMSTELKFYADSGDLIDAAISKRLLMSIFNKTSPLHDGAVIIANGRINAARCILPVSENPDVPASMGLRHRAAIGLTEVTDAVVLVVSEETGQVSLVRSGEVFRNLAPADLRARLNEFLFNAAPRAATTPTDVAA
ncbi:MULTISPECIES: diadenylate cyclase CdaA [Hymenobacter]|uniref:Diadenylate cyclase n=2 Tax=Hymenobacter TaxID=89966 RepID=A0ABS6X585_9BACT|nr:diadenylate cyclase CdaA [Hymenobacter sp. NBH84]MBO3270192.1 diadenylate cyclase CdaA [Hymenobacter defluvii]MBW3130998.1 diadenylate cyclase CdaA [Hymenobacter profundi]QNE41061.1 TIGR00159 family protein [Hymenobacter sp. NBH84]